MQSKKQKTCQFLRSEFVPNSQPLGMGMRRQRIQYFQYIKCLWHYSSVIIQCPYMLNETLNIVQTREPYQCIPYS